MRSALLIVLAAVLPRIPTLAEPLAMDQALFAVIGEGLLRGERLYVDLWDHKPPGIYLLYAGISAITGGAAWGINLAGLLASVATALLLSRVVAARSGAAAGTLAGILYGLLANPILLGGFYATAQAEVFMETLLAASIVLAQRSARGPGLAAGMALGCAVLLKPTALLFAPVLFLARAAPSAGAREGRSAADCGRFALGVAAPAIVAFAGLLAMRALGAAYDALVVWNSAALGLAARSTDGGSIPSSLPGLASLLLDGILLLGPFLLFAVAGAALSPARAFPLVWCGLAVVAVLVQGKFYRYQYQGLLAPLIGLAALGIVAAIDGARRRLPRAAVPAVAVLALLSIVPFAATARAYWTGHRYRLPLPTGEARKEFLRTYAWSGTGMRFEDADRVAALVRAHSEPGERIYILGFDPQIYLLADRAPAGRYLAHDHLRAPGAEARLAEDLARRRPRWVVVATDQVADTDFPLVSAWIAENTTPRGAIGRFALFERTL